MLLSLGRKAIPGADNLAVIAAKDPVAHHWAQCLGNGLLAFDSEIGNTLSGIQYIGLGKGISRTNF